MFFVLLFSVQYHQNSTNVTIKIALRMSREIVSEIFYKMSEIFRERFSSVHAMRIFIEIVRYENIMFSGIYEGNENTKILLYFRLKKYLKKQGRQVTDVCRLTTV